MNRRVFLQTAAASVAAPALVPQVAAADTTDRDASAEIAASASASA
jgi:hypothetical protein